MYVIWNGNSFFVQQISTQTDARHWPNKRLSNIYWPFLVQRQLELTTLSTMYHVAMFISWSLSATATNQILLLLRLSGYVAATNAKIFINIQLQFPQETVEYMFRASPIYLCIILRCGDGRYSHCNITFVCLLLLPKRFHRRDLTWMNYGFGWSG